MEKWTWRAKKKGEKNADFKVHNKLYNSSGKLFLLGKNYPKPLEVSKIHLCTSYLNLEIQLS